MSNGRLPSTGELVSVGAGRDLSAKSLSQNEFRQPRGKYQEQYFRIGCSKITEWVRWCILAEVSKLYVWNTWWGIEGTLHLFCMCAALMKPVNSRWLVYFSMRSLILGIQHHPPPPSVPFHPSWSWSLITKALFDIHGWMSWHLSLVFAFINPLHVWEFKECFELKSDSLFFLLFFLVFYGLCSFLASLLYLDSIIFMIYCAYKLLVFVFTFKELFLVH